MCSSRTPKKRGNVWKCQCDCGNICYKTSADIKDKRRKTLSCGCQNKGGRKFPNQFIPKAEVSKENAIIKLSENYGVIELLTATIMRNNNLSYDKAYKVAERLNSSDCLFDRLVDNILEE